MRFRPARAVVALLLAAPPVAAQDSTTAQLPFTITLAPADSAKLQMVERIYGRLEARVEQHPEIAELLDLGSAMGRAMADTAHMVELYREFLTGLGSEGERAIGAAMVSMMLGDISGACEMGRRLSRHFLSLPPATQVEMVRAGASWGARMKPMPPTGLPGEEGDEPVPESEAGAAGKRGNIQG